MSSVIDTFTAKAPHGIILRAHSKSTCFGRLSVSIRSPFSVLGNAQDKMFSITFLIEWLNVLKR